MVEAIKKKATRRDRVIVYAGLPISMSMFESASRRSGMGCRRREQRRDDGSNAGL